MHSPPRFDQAGPTIFVRGIAATSQPRSSISSPATRPPWPRPEFLQWWQETGAENPACLIKASTFRMRRMFGGCDQRDGQATLAGGPAGVANAMDIDFRIQGQVKLKTCEMSSISATHVPPSSPPGLEFDLRKRLILFTCIWPYIAM